MAGEIAFLCSLIEHMRQWQAHMEQCWAVMSPEHQNQLRSTHGTLKECSEWFISHADSASFEEIAEHVLRVDAAIDDMMRTPIGQEIAKREGHVMPRVN